MAKNALSDQSRKSSAQMKLRTNAYAEKVRLEFASTVNGILALNKQMPTLEQGAMFSFDGANKRVREQVELLLRRLHSVVSLSIEKGISLEWELANKECDELVESIFGKSALSNPDFSAWLQRNTEARDAFMKRTSNGFNLSKNIWNTCQQLKEEMEVAMTVAIGEGDSASSMSRRVRKYLNDPELMFRRFRYKDENGRWQRKWKKKIRTDDGRVKWIDYDKDSYKVGKGMYKSSAKNAMRVTRSETNMAYRASDHERWQQMDFILGQKIQLSQKHTEEHADICDELAGEYPIEFQFTGWHPQCYADDTSVLTDVGWKLFKDVKKSDRILSLNPDTKEMEWAGISDVQCWHKTGEMVHYFSRNLDCLVTPEHRMVYLAKTDGRIAYKQANEFRMTQGAFYRGADYSAKDIESITIGGIEYDFDWFCEFMGYWLSDGSIIRNSQITIAQKDGERSKAVVRNCLERYFNVSSSLLTLDCYCNALCLYLKQFGVCNKKYVPSEIMNASQRQIRIFLDAFSICDGHHKKPRYFIGSRGNVCSPKEDEITYFTTSEKLAGGLSELLLKVGRRPSYSVIQPRNAVKKDGTIVHSNYPCYRISECHSVTATTFNKERVQYDAMVYDLTLDRNHIMYVARNGTCFWGSNCYCFATPILLDDDEMLAMSRARRKGEPYTPKAKRIDKMPENFTKWVKANKGKIIASRELGTEPYFLRDNEALVDGIINPTSKMRTPLERAAIRHVARTPEQRAAIRMKWLDRAILNMEDRARECGGQVQSIAEEIASKHGATVTPINYKSFGSIKRKVLTERQNIETPNFMPSQLKDTVRTTIIGEKGKLADIRKDLESLENCVFKKPQKTNLGYTGYIANFRMKNGVVAEIQVNTAKMIYAKEPPTSARQILGEDVWNAIQKETGMEGGLGHKYYEKHRVLNPESREAQDIQKKSVEYYSHFI